MLEQKVALGFMQTLEISHKARESFSREWAFRITVINMLKVVAASGFFNPSLKKSPQPIYSTSEKFFSLISYCIAIF